MRRVRYILASVMLATASAVFLMPAWAESLAVDGFALVPVGLSLTPVAATAELQAEIDRVSAAGGGRVTVPVGEWTIGTIWLKDGVRFENVRVMRAPGVNRPQDYLIVK